MMMIILKYSLNRLGARLHFIIFQPCRRLALLNLGNPQLSCLIKYLTNALNVCAIYSEPLQYAFHKINVLNRGFCEYCTTFFLLLLFSVHFFYPQIFYCVERITVELTESYRFSTDAFQFPIHLYCSQFILFPAIQVFCIFYLLSILYTIKSASLN